MKSGDTSADVQAAAARKVIARVKLGHEGMATFAIPRNAKPAETAYDPAYTDCLYYTNSLKGGKVHVLVKGKDPDQYRDRRVVARFAIWKIKYDDEGPCDLCIEIEPLDVDEPTHKVRVIPTEELPKEFNRMLGTRIIRPAKPMVGAILIRRI